MKYNYETSVIIINKTLYRSFLFFDRVYIMAVRGVYLSLGLLLTSTILIKYSVSEECTLHKPNDEIKTKGLLKNISVLSGQT